MIEIEGDRQKVERLRTKYRQKMSEEDKQKNRKNTWKNTKKLSQQCVEKN